MRLKPSDPTTRFRVPKWMTMQTVAATWLIALGGVCPAVTDAESPSRPNVILIMTDDQGYGDLSCHGNPILKTPNLDQLHDQSIRLTNYHVFPTCSPTRAALMTGRTADRTGVWHTIAGRSMLPADEKVMPEYLRPAGYATAMFGKWHLGDNFPMRPIDRSFDEVFAHGGGGMGQTPDVWDNAYFDATYLHNGHRERVDGFCTDVFFDQATRFIETQAADERPFFAYIATNAAHSPMHSPPEYAQPYLDADLDVRTANFFGMIANIDVNVGKLLQTLDRLKIAEDTVLIFTTDNGSAGGWKVFNASMRAAKGSMYEGGHRVPLFIRYPAGDLGPPRSIDTLTTVTDVLPTLLSWCQVTDAKISGGEGHSWSTLFRGEAKTDNGDSWADRTAVVDSQRVRDPIRWRSTAVCRGHWRLVNDKELYNVADDPGQRRNVITQHQPIAKSLRDWYDQWWRDVEPTFSTPSRIVIGHPAAPKVLLTSHDWITDAVTPWNQADIRKGKDATGGDGFWNIDVVEAGVYSMTLRRWPAAIDHPIVAALASGEPVPGQDAYRTTPGASIQARSFEVFVGDQSVTDGVVTEDASSITVDVDLPAGPNRLRANFGLSDGRTMGAYYVDVSSR